MEQPGDQTKIHLNPNFIPRGSGTLPNQRVHINPAFLQKSQGVHQTQKYVTPAAHYTTTTTHHRQGLMAGAGRPASQLNTSQCHTLDRNTATNVYSYSSKSVHDRRVPSSSSHLESHSNLYKKSNLYSPYDKSYSRYKDFCQTQTDATKNSVVAKHPSTYSWKASNSNAQTSHQVNPSASWRVHNNVNPNKDSRSFTTHYMYPFSGAEYSNNKTLVHTKVMRRVSDIKIGIEITRPVKNKQTASHSSLPSLSHDKTSTQSSRNVAKLAEKTNPSTVIMSKIKTEPASPNIATSTNMKRVSENTSTSSHLKKIKSELEPSDSLTHGQSKSDLLKAPKIEVSSISNPLKAEITGSPTTSKLVQVTPKQKWVSKSKVVNSSPETLHTKTHVKNIGGTKITLKTPKPKGNYKIITKTKLVRTNSNSAAKRKTQQHTALGGQSGAQTSKATTSPRVTAISRLLKASPPTRVLHNAARLPTKKYSVLSRTKLVRRQSLSGKSATPGKPKYSVNTKNKLIRRRSNSGGSKLSSKASEGKARVSMPESERQKKFHVLSKTKIVRRRSSSGSHKAASTQGAISASTGHSKKRAIVKRHKLVRNVPSASLKHEATKFSRSFPKNVNTAFKVINATPKLSTKQKIAKGIISKYKINRLKMESPEGYKKYQSAFERYRVNRVKLDSANGLKRYRKFVDYSSKARQKTKFKFGNKGTRASKHSDRFINIGGILYKSTKTSLRKQLPKANKTTVKKHDSTCTVFLRGEKFHLTAGGRTLRRVKDSTPVKSSLPRVHLGGLTYSRTRTGLYELTKSHQARAVLSSARQRSMVTLLQKRRKASFQKRNEYCVFFNRFGRCSKKNRGECAYIHDQSRVAICTRFLRGRCPVNNCPFSHTIDPDKMPVCSHFLQAACTREDCPYRHVRVNPSAPVCLDFVSGHCKAGKECDKQHVLICEEFKKGNCPRGKSCPLSHHKGQKRPRRVSFSRDSKRRSSTSIYRKRKISETLEILGGPVIINKRVKKTQELKPRSSHRRYFHVIATQESEDKDTQDAPENSELNENTEQKVISEEASQNTTKTQPASDSRPSKQAEGLGSETHGDTADCGNCSSTPASKSVFEETRSRVMRKIDKMKKSYTSYTGEDPIIITGNSDTDGNMMDCKVEPEDSHLPTNAKKEINKSGSQVTLGEKSTENSSDTDNPDSDPHKVQRPPLPKRLPSYIPLDSA